MSTNPATQPAIKIHALSITYRSRWLLRDFSTNIAQGEFIGILGPNGAGKSTLLKAILGLVKPLSGEIIVLGQKSQRGYAKIGYMPQLRQNDVVTHFSGRALLEATLNGLQWGLPILYHQQKIEVNRVLEMVDAQVFADRPFQHLSGGERQRIFLAQALLNDPQILLLDEPLANLDPRYQEELIDVIRRVQKLLKVTVLFTAHDVNLLLPVIDRVLYITQGNAAIGSIDEVITSDKLTALYKVPIEVVRHNGRIFVIGQERNLLGQEAHE